MNQNCPFCQIIAGELPARIVYQDDLFTAFWDRAPIAPLHVLIVPNQHIPSLNAAAPHQQDLLGQLLLTARRIAEEQGVAESGFRLLINTGADAGQSVFHLHVHLIAGKRFPLNMATQ